MKNTRQYLFAFLLMMWVSSLLAQNKEKDLGDKEYVIIKDYKPVLADALKISDVPKGDTSTVASPKMKYNPEPRKLETIYETGVIKPVKIKDEPLTKLYPALLKLGIGNYSTYYGELFLNSLRSKTNQYGLHLNHISGNPTLKDVSYAGFSKSGGEAYGKYFLDNATISGILGFDQQTLHYYGLNPSDTIVQSSEIKQRFNHLNIGAGIKSNWLSNDHFNYNVTLRYQNLNDLYAATENDFLLNAEVGQMFVDKYFTLLASFDYFKKTDANFEVLDINSNLSRNIINLNPTMTVNNDKIHMRLGFDFALEKNLGTDGHLYPVVEINVPIAEHIVSIYANVTGNLQKNNFRTLTLENEFTTSAVKTYKNTSEKIILDGGVTGAFSNQTSFNASGKYKMADDMGFFYNDTLQPNKFNVVYDNGSVLDIHGELAYHHNEKLTLAGHLDLYSYKMDTIAKPYHKPNMEIGITGKYNLVENIFLNAALLSRGSQYARIIEDSVFTVKKMNGYVDLNAGVEYRYMKNLSFFANFNNILMSNYERWYAYPSEKFNFLAGLTYSF